ncbi:MAG: hypothetical protein OEV62_09535 [Actinomycetota bacterium]|nr:hypothetical protein [Actinomycetota bacterium]MDH4353304.1 hypothetical protein [Actinomycetota bacterium]
MPAEPAGDGRHLAIRVVSWAAIVVAVCLGLGMVGLAATLGSCSAFGGRCPADAPPWYDDDVFGMAAMGAALVVAVPWFLSRPSRRRLVQALVAGAVAAVLVGLVVRSAAHG